MRKTQVTYLTMMLVFAAGLWAILRIGSRLHAARNVAGEWELRSTDGGPRLPDHLTLRQSGKFLTGTLQGRPDTIQLHGELDQASKMTLRASGGRQLTMTATLDEGDGGGKLVARFEGDISADAIATRAASASSAAR